MFRPLWAILMSQKYNEEKICSMRTLVVVHILSFQRHLVVLRLSTLKTARRDLVESSEYAQLMFLYCIFSPHYIFFWSEDGPQWSKHVSLINRTQRQLCFDVPLPLLICIKHNGDDASKEFHTSCICLKYWVCPVTGMKFDVHATPRAVDLYHPYVRFRQL